MSTTTTYLNNLILQYEQMNKNWDPYSPNGAFKEDINKVKIELERLYKVRDKQLTV